MNKKILEKYAELKDFSKSLALEVKDVEGKVLKVIRGEGVKSISLPVGTFTIVDYTQYEFSEAVEKAAAKLSLLKQKEIVMGIAKATKESEGVRFTPTKKHE